jgi:hypothetical protein
MSEAASELLLQPLTADILFSKNNAMSTLPLSSTKFLIAKMPILCALI